jgi:hypothetical protein
MAKIVLGIGASHSPLLTFSAKRWMERADDDRRNQTLALSDGRTLSYDELLAERGPVFAEFAQEPHLVAQAERAQAALDRLAAAIRDAAPDVMLIIGDDQEEFYAHGNQPSFAVFYGEEIVMRPLGEILPNPSRWMQEAISGYGMETDNRYPAAPHFAERLIDSLMDRSVDLAVASKVADPRAAAFGHAYGFIVRRLMPERSIPVVPLFLNTYYPPNVIRPKRCFEIGQLIAHAVDAMPGDTRVAVVASGGLSHFVTDETLDRGVLQALQSGDEAGLTSLPMAALRTGSSEILCWVMAAGAFHDLGHAWSDYVPVYRTPAGTGIGLAFGIWNCGPA